VRQRAIRNKWARLVGNDKRARVRLPDEPYPTQTPIVRASDEALMDALREHNATLKAEVERLETALAAAEVRAEKQAAESAEQLAAERERADKAIAAFAALADRLDALAAERARPWWKRLAG
jgi:hypothetical protein